MLVATRRFVRPEHLNHHQSLYAGCLSEWMTEAGFIAMSRTMQRTDHFVLAAIREIRITKPVCAGTVLSLYYTVENVGTTSVELRIRGKNDISGESHCEGSIVFVTVDDEGKKTPHGLVMNEGKQ